MLTIHIVGHLLPLGQVLALPIFDSATIIAKIPFFSFARGFTPFVDFRTERAIWIDVGVLYGFWSIWSCCVWLVGGYMLERGVLGGLTLIIGCDIFIIFSSSSFIRHSCFFWEILNLSSSLSSIGLFSLFLMNFSFLLLILLKLLMDVLLWYWFYFIHLLTDKIISNRFKLLSILLTLLNQPMLNRNITTLLPAL